MAENVGRSTGRQEDNVQLEEGVHKIGVESVENRHLRGKDENSAK